MVVLGFALLCVAVLVLPTLTALGARRRGAGLPLAALSGLCFPVTWTWWYVRDVRPYDRDHQNV